MTGDGQDAAVLQAQIEKLLQEVSAVSDGDLRVQAEVTPDTLGVLADSFNYMIEELAKVVGRVQATTLQVTNATRRLLDRSAEVSAGLRGAGAADFAVHPKPWLVWPISCSSPPTTRHPDRRRRRRALRNVAGRPASRRADH